MNFLYVFLGGGFGSLARYGLARLLPGVDDGFPWATLTANFLACLLLGYGLSLLTDGRLADHHKLILLTGFCGGFSTFSTFSAELLELWSSGRGATAALYALLSLVSGVAAIFLLIR